MLSLILKLPWCALFFHIHRLPIPPSLAQIPHSFMKPKYSLFSLNFYSNISRLLQCGYLHACLIPTVLYNLKRLTFTDLWLSDRHCTLCTTNHLSFKSILLCRYHCYLHLTKRSSCTEQFKWLVYDLMVARGRAWQSVSTLSLLLLSAACGTLGGRAHIWFTFTPIRTLPRTVPYAHYAPNCNLLNRCIFTLQSQLIINR